ncbi:acetyl esterase [Leucobacter exalbidus]|uniref:Acetyl esterase n=1 Tax=Leucobacter exalbidus TaxID=662960 RepID=A0A940PNS0_9MICO|nr:alpha/beta hydrolase [Leucobacter exalbidus]MBP1327367.1 acetyl esterase [Leucobacter exalbidus]
MSLFPIEAVAADQRELIAAFRAAGSRSFQDAGSMAASREGYERSSAANGLPRDPIASVEDVSIGQGDDQFGVRVYDPRPAGGAADTDAVILFAHGGGWIIGSLDTHDAVCRRLASLTGLPVVAIDYRLGPEHHFPAAHLDARRAVEWLRDHAGERAWNPHQIVTAGDSAGGGIATALAFEPSLLVTGTSIAAQVLLYPVVDVSAESAGYARVEEGFPLTADTMRWFAAEFLASPADASDPRVSPLLAVRAGNGTNAAQPPAWILTLGLDPLAEEGLEYAQLLAMNGTHVELTHLPAHAHGIFTSAGKIRAGEVQLARAAEFITRICAEA